MTIARRVAGGGVGLLVSLALACGDDDATDPLPEGHELHHLHFDLDEEGFLSMNEDYVLVHGGKRYPLVEHDEDTLAAYLERVGGSLPPPAEGDDGLPSHHVRDVPISMNKVTMLQVHQVTDNAGTLDEVHGGAYEHGLALVAIHIPGRQTPPVDKADGELETSEMATYTPGDIAKSLLYHHPELLQLDPTPANDVMDAIETAPQLTDLEYAIKGLGPTGWYKIVQYQDTDGSPITMPEGSGTPLFQYQVADAVTTAAAGPLKHSLNTTKQDPDLKCVTYVTADCPARTSTTARKWRDTAGGYTYQLGHKDSLMGINAAMSVSDTGRVTLTFGHWYLNHVEAFIRFFDEAGPVVPEGWETAETGTATASLPDTLKYLSFMPPPATVFGIPFEPIEFEVAFDWPPNATHAEIYFGGLGFGGWWEEVQLTGTAMTVALNLALPSILLAASAGESNADLAKSLSRNIAVINFAISLMTTIKGAKALTPNAAIQLALKSAFFIAKVMTQKDILTYILTRMEVAEAEDTAGFAGWAMNMASLVGTGIALAETTVETFASPGVQTLHLSRSHDVQVTVDHDPDDFEFPATASRLEVSLVFTNAETFTQRIELVGSVTEPQTVTFTGAPAGGTVGVLVAAYADSGAIVGRASTDGAIANQNDAGSDHLAVSLTLEELLVPLTSTTQYTHKIKLDYQSSAYEWTATTTAPTDTISALSDSANAGTHVLGGLGPISIDQHHGWLGFSWLGYADADPLCSATGRRQSYKYGIVTVGEDPARDMHLATCGEIVPQLVVMDPLGVRNYVIVPEHDATTNTDEYVVRSFDFDGAGAFSMGGEYGRFALPLDAVALHPSGRLVGINHAYAQLFILMPALRGADDPPTMAIQANGQASSLMPSNPRLLNAPRALAITTDGAILVLEDVSSLSGSNLRGRVRAFDQSGEPKLVFGAQGNEDRFELREETQPTTYLDLGVDKAGFLFVLSYLGTGTSVADFRLDIYRPDGTWLVQTPNFAVARMAVDYWRNLYTASYHVFVGAGGIEVPSVNQWIPSVPSP